MQLSPFNRCTATAFATKLLLLRKFTCKQLLLCSGAFGMRLFFWQQGWRRLFQTQKGNRFRATIFATIFCDDFFPIVFLLKSCRKKLSKKLSPETKKLLHCTNLLLNCYAITCGLKACMSPNLLCASAALCQQSWNLIRLLIGR